MIDIIHIKYYSFNTKHDIEKIKATNKTKNKLIDTAQKGGTSEVRGGQTVKEGQIHGNGRNWAMVVSTKVSI